MSWDMNTAEERGGVEEGERECKIVEGGMEGEVRISGYKLL